MHDRGEAMTTKPEVSSYGNDKAFGANDSATYEVVILILPILIFVRDSWIAFSVPESSDAVASSIKMILGGFRMALAMAIYTKD